MSEQEDKPKPEGEQLSAGGKAAAKLEELFKEMRGMPAEFEGKSLDELVAELMRKSMGELLEEVLSTTVKIIQLVAEVKDWDDLQEELLKKFLYIHNLQTVLANRSKKSGDYKKWAQAFTAEREASLVVEIRSVKEHVRLYRERIEDLNDPEDWRQKARENNLSVEQYFQMKMIISLEKMIFDNYKSSAEGRKRSIRDSIPVLQFQAETTETMLEVKEEQAKTATILEKVEGRLESSEQVQAKTAKILEEVERQQKRTGDILEKVAENTNPAQQFILIVAASALVAISFGLLVDIIFLKWNDEIKEHWVAAILSVIVIGVFAILAIKKWVFGKIK